MNRLYAMLAAVLSFSAAAFALFKKGESAGKAEVIAEATEDLLEDVKELKTTSDEADEIINNGSIADRLDRL